MSKNKDLFDEGYNNETVSTGNWMGTLIFTLLPFWSVLTLFLWISGTFGNVPWMGSFLLIFFAVASILPPIIWAAGGKTKAKRNYGKAMLWMTLIWAVILFTLGTIFAEEITNLGILIQGGSAF